MKLRLIWIRARFKTVMIQDIICPLRIYAGGKSDAINYIAVLRRPGTRVSPGQSEAHRARRRNPSSLCVSYDLLRERLFKATHTHFYSRVCLPVNRNRRLEIELTHKQSKVDGRHRLRFVVMHKLDV